MFSSELISVIVPVYKVEQYLDRCIKSVINQTYRNLEIILVDDGSPDKCPQICDKWAEADKRVKVIHKENGGVATARNAGLRIASGLWISFVDSDDWLHHQFFEILMKQACDTKASIIAAEHLRTKQYDSHIEKGLRCVPFENVNIDKVFRNRSIRNYIWGKIYRATLLEGLFFDECLSYGDDSLYVIRLLLKKDVRICYTDEQLYYYYDREESIVNTVSLLDRIILSEKYYYYAQNEIQELPKSFYLSESIKRALSARYITRFGACFKEYSIRCNHILKNCLEEYLPLHCVSSIDKCAYVVFTYLPGLYRLWRLNDDHTLLDWEKNIRIRIKRGEIEDMVINKYN